MTATNKTFYRIENKEEGTNTRVTLIENICRCCGKCYEDEIEVTIKIENEEMEFKMDLPSDGLEWFKDLLENKVRIYRTGENQRTHYCQVTKK